MKNAELNEAEIRLLSGFPFSKSRIAEGNLSQFEQKSLEELRILMETIKMKYPDVSFVWHSFQPKFGIQSRPELCFGVDEDEERYMACVETVRLADGTEVRQALDNYYGTLISAELCELIYQVTGAQQIKAKVTALRGIEFDSTITAKELLDCGKLPESVITLTAAPSQMNLSLLERWKNQLTASGIPGFYQVYMSYGDASLNRMYCGSFSVSACGNRRA